MPSRTLTVAAAARIKPPAKGQADHFDKGFPGLALRVSYGGSKTWVFFYRLHGGKVRRLTLGRWPGMELADARAAWQEARKMVGKGESPKPRKPLASGGFAGVVDLWLRRDQAANRSFSEVKRVFERDIKPVFEDRLITTIGRAEIVDLLDGIADRGAVVLARRIQAHLHRLFRWSVGRGIISANPIADMDKVGDAVARDRVLSDSELAIVWQAAAWDPASKAGWPFGPAIRLLILTAARREEIAALRWREIVADRIKLTATRTKNGQPHIVPLSNTAAEIIRELPRIAGSEFVFTTTGASAISGWSRAKTLLDKAAARLRDDGRALAPWRIHDLRRTVATGMQRLGLALPVVEAVLGHVAGSRAGIVGVYQRHDYDSEKRAALEAWSQHVASITVDN